MDTYICVYIYNICIYISYIAAIYTAAYLVKIYIQSYENAQFAPNNFLLKYSNDVHSQTNNNV